MKTGRHRKYVPQIGSILILLLIGLVLLSALLYYRAVKIQRFLEPALALSQPRNEFTKRIAGLFQKEFGAGPIKGLDFKAGSILMHKSVLFSRDGALLGSGQNVIKKLARIFLSLLKDEQARPELNLIMIITRVPSRGKQGTDMTERMRANVVAGFMQDALFRAEPELGIRYPTYFAAVTEPADPHDGNTDILEIRVLPSEFLHIRMLERLEKYAY